jgi:hypothetical protein
VDNDPNRVIGDRSDALRELSRLAPRDRVEVYPSMEAASEARGEYFIAVATGRGEHRSVSLRSRVAAIRDDGTVAVWIPDARGESLYEAMRASEAVSRRTHRLAVDDRRRAEQARRVPRGPAKALTVKEQWAVSRASAAKRGMLRALRGSASTLPSPESSAHSASVIRERRKQASRDIQHDMDRRYGPRKRRANRRGKRKAKK